MAGMHTPAPAHTGTPARIPGMWRAALWALVAAVLAGVFALYLQPNFVVTLADQVWACL